MEDAVIKAAARVLMDAALNVLQEDPHSWSTRPCPTCRAVSSLVGRPFGCYKYQGDRSKVENGG